MVQNVKGGGKGAGAPSGLRSERRYLTRRRFWLRDNQRERCRERRRQGCTCFSSGPRYHFPCKPGSYFKTPVWTLRHRHSVSRADPRRTTSRMVLARGSSAWSMHSQSAGASGISLCSSA